ncbi:hypothetical protein L6452_09514 [Arctium lappa]|uniref:Uncharacterized protein n=1 Tax=Arctium lappa TaxID=4217 RepID=A0ACB9DLF1_ARCLA|nr:hypothetical protein L6452_09514 [Arctium lappa]
MHPPKHLQPEFTVKNQPQTSQHDIHEHSHLSKAHPQDPILDSGQTIPIPDHCTAKPQSNSSPDTIEQSSVETEPVLSKKSYRTIQPAARNLLRLSNPSRPNFSF